MSIEISREIETRLAEEARRQMDAHHLELLDELGPDPGRLQAALDNFPLSHSSATGAPATAPLTWSKPPRVTCKLASTPSASQSSRSCSLC